MSAREAAMLTLTAMERRKAWSNGQLKKIIREQQLDRRDAALTTRLCMGVLQNRMLLDFYLQHFASMKLQKMETKVLTNLRIGLYQMLFMSKIPVSAAVSEAVELTKKHCKSAKAPGLVNGILRNIHRHIYELPTLDRTDEVNYLSMYYSHPRWMVEEVIQTLGKEEAEAFLRSDNEEVPVIVQVNTTRSTIEDASALLEKEGVSVKQHPWLENCLLLEHLGDMEARSVYQSGAVYAQDPAAKLAVRASGVTTGMRVLDACAAPGGKSFAAAVQMNNQGEIVSCDIHPHKQALIRAGAERLGFTSISAFVCDAREPKNEWMDSFDVVLADVPCSGLGVIRKKPEIRYKEREEFARLPDIQLSILNSVSRCLKQNGVLLYSTCTIRPEENEQVVERFLQQHPEFSLEAFTLPGPIGKVESGYITLWPHRLETDGFFIARLHKNGSGKKGEEV